MQLKSEARRIVRLTSYGQMPTITPHTFDAAMELIENDVLMHDTYPEQGDRLRHLGEMIEAHDPG